MYLWRQGSSHGGVCVCALGYTRRANTLTTAIKRNVKQHALNSDQKKCKTTRLHQVLVVNESEGDWWWCGDDDGGDGDSLVTGGQDE